MNGHEHIKNLFGAFGIDIDAPDPEPEVKLCSRCGENPRHGPLSICEPCWMDQRQRYFAERATG